MSEETPKISEQTGEKQGTNPNLFKKGQSGNPNGRPKGTVSITTEIRARLLKIYPEKQAAVTDDNGKKIIKIIDLILLRVMIK